MTKKFDDLPESMITQAAVSYVQNEYKAIGMNTVIVQVRPKADALYASSINPWSDVLTGTQGKDPGYDPLQFMIDELVASPTIPPAL